MSEATLPVIIKNYIRKDGQGESIFDFEKIIPIGDVPDWYEQRLEKWGTKWIGYDLIIGVSTIDFFTAWSPPIPVIRKLAELHKDVTFTLEYAEPGMMFRGTATAKWQDGDVLLEDNCRDMTEQDLKDVGLV
jgi:hypothetical protein